MLNSFNKSSISTEVRVIREVLSAAAEIHLRQRQEEVLFYLQVWPRSQWKRRTVKGTLHYFPSVFFPTLDVLRGWSGAAPSGSLLQQLPQWISHTGGNQRTSILLRCSLELSGATDSSLEAADRIKIPPSPPLFAFTSLLDRTSDKLKEV